MEWQAEQKLKCGSCGHFLDESMDSENARAYEAGEMTCHACQVIEWRQHSLSEQERDMAGLRVYATRKAGHG